MKSKITAVILLLSLLTTPCQSEGSISLLAATCRSINTQRPQAVGMNRVSRWANFKTKTAYNFLRSSKNKYIREKALECIKRNIGDAEHHTVMQIARRGVLDATLEKSHPKSYVKAAKKQAESFLGQEEASSETQSAIHLCNTFPIRLITSNCYGQTYHPTQKMLSTIPKIHEWEITERKKGNYVGYHARNKQLNLKEDLFKKMLEIKNNKTIVNPILRFEEKPDDLSHEIKKRLNAMEGKDNYFWYSWNTLAGAFINSPSKGLKMAGGIICNKIWPPADRLFMNHALFGNESISYASAIRFWIMNSYMESKISTLSLFQQFGLEKYYYQNRKELKKLKDFHKKAYASNEMLAISLTPKQLKKCVIPTIYHGQKIEKTVNGKKTSDSKTILDDLIKNPKPHEYHEFALVITHDYALDSKNGPTIKSFMVTDKKNFKVYKEKLDQLFAKIAEDIKKDGPQEDTFSIPTKNQIVKKQIENELFDDLHQEPNFQRCFNFKELNSEF